MLPDQSVEELIREAQECLGLDAVNHYNICVCGPSGVGKSSFINGIRGLRASDPGAARVSTSAVVVFPRRYFVQTPPPPPPLLRHPILLVDTDVAYTIHGVVVCALYGVHAFAAQGPAQYYVQTVRLIYTNCPVPTLSRASL